MFTRAFWYVLPRNADDLQQRSSTLPMVPPILRAISEKELPAITLSSDKAQGQAVYKCKEPFSGTERRKSRGKRQHFHNVVLRSYPRECLPLSEISHREDINSKDTEPLKKLG